MEQHTNKCNFGQCDKQPKFEVRFSLRTHAFHPPSISSPILVVCDDHMDIEWKDVCDDNGWNQICSQLKQQGLLPPEKEFSHIEIVPIK